MAKGGAGVLTMGIGDGSVENLIGLSSVESRGAGNTFSPNNEGSEYTNTCSWEAAIVLYWSIHRCKGTPILA